MTPAQHKVWSFIVEFRKTRERSPTIREIMRGVGVVGPATIHERIETLVKDGRLIRFRHDMGMPTCYIPVVRYHGEA